jgi:signal transduction histidine kinase
MFLEIMQRGEDAYDSMNYRAVQVENAVRVSGDIRNINPNYFEDIVSRDERLTIYDAKSKSKFTYVSKEERREVSEGNKKLVAWVIGLLAKKYQKEIEDLGNFYVYTDEVNGYTYASLTHEFKHITHTDTVTVTRNVTSVINKPVSRYQDTFYFYLLYFFITAGIFTFMGINSVFRLLGKAIDKSFVELEENDYTSRLHITGQYGKEITTVKHKINDVLERMKHIIDINTESMQDVSHEVNNKLTSIKQSVDVLRIYGTEDKEMVDQKLKSIDDNISRITKVMSTILDLAKLNQGSYTASSEPQNVKELIETYLSHERKVHPEYNLITKYDSVNPTIRINKEHFFLALNPIIENAIRYSVDSKNIIIHVVDLDCPNNLCLSITNWGLEIEEKEIPYLFNRYYRGKKLDNVIEGSGLGLTISKKVMELYNGQIEVKSNKIGKTTFTLVIPKGDVAE